MYKELGSIKGIVDLSPEHALDEAEAFLASQGYSILRRTSTTLTAERRSSDQAVGEAVPNLTVVAMPQTEGGVQIKVRGDDFEGVQARQSEWIGWSEGLPRKAQGEANASTDEQGGIGAAEIDQPPPEQAGRPLASSIGQLFKVQRLINRVFMIGTIVAAGLAIPESSWYWIDRPWTVLSFALFGVSAIYGYWFGRSYLSTYVSYRLAQGQVRDDVEVAPYSLLARTAAVTGLGALAIAIFDILRSEVVRRGLVELIRVYMQPSVLLVFLLILLITFTIPFMFIMFGGLTGLAHARQRQYGGEHSPNPGETPRRVRDWTPRQQAMVGLIGTIVTAFLTLVGVLVQVFAGGG